MQTGKWKNIVSNVFCVQAVTKIGKVITIKDRKENKTNCYMQESIYNNNNTEINHCKSLTVKMVLTGVRKSFHVNYFLINMPMRNIFG